MGIEAAELLREGLLDGVRLAVAAAPESAEGSAAAELISAARGLGAKVGELALAPAQDAEAEERAAEEAAAAALAQLGAISALVVDAGSVFAARPEEQRLSACLAASWNAARAVATRAFIPGEVGGRVVLLAPEAGAPHAGAAVAGLENLARTLSIEWARYGVTPVAVAPGARSEPAELAALACWLLSPAGAYFSGCLLDLRGPR